MKRFLIKISYTVLPVWLLLVGMAAYLWLTDDNTGDLMRLGLIDSGPEYTDSIRSSLLPQVYYTWQGGDSLLMGDSCDVLVIGDSFFWNISGSVPLGYLFSRYQYWYYNSTIYFNDQYDHTSQIDILDEILHSRIINLSYSPRQLYIFSDGFLPKALLYLTHEDQEIDSTLHALAITMEGDSDEEKMEAAKDSLFFFPEVFFPDLAEEGVPTTRNSRIQEIL